MSRSVSGVDQPSRHVALGLRRLPVVGSLLDFASRASLEVSVADEGLG